MKKAAVPFIVFILLFTFCACSAGDKCDDLCRKVMKAVLARDTAALDGLTHPSHRGELDFGDGFYAELATFEITPGMELVSMSGPEIRYNEGDGYTLYFCNYVAVIEEMYYSVNACVLDNGEGFGLISLDIGFPEGLEGVI